MKKKRNVVFLDIDGVLNRAAYDEEICDVYDATRYVERELADKLSEWGNDNGVEFVGISAWFIGRTAETSAIADFLGIRMTETSKHCGGGFHRGIGVLDYVEKHGLTNWCVLDDAGGGMYGFPTVVVNGRLGITQYDLANAEFMLDNSPPLSKIPLWREEQIKQLKRG